MEEMFNCMSLKEVKEKLARGDSLKKVLNNNVGFHNIKYDLIDSSGRKEIIASGELFIRTDTYNQYISRFGIASISLHEDKKLTELFEEAISLAYTDAAEKVCKSLRIKHTDMSHSIENTFVLNVAGIGQRTDTYVEVYATCINGKAALIISEEEDTYMWLTKLRPDTRITLKGKYEGMSSNNRILVRAEKLLSSEPLKKAI